VAGVTSADFVTSAQLPLVSIVLTTLNGARYLREAIDSCLAQTYADLELIVVDGGSTDGTLDIVASYTDPRVVLVHQRNNIGKLPGALNLGLSLAHGAYLTWMQDDCVYEPTALEAMVHCLQAHPNIGQVYTDYWQIDAEGTIVKLQTTCDPHEILQSRSDPTGVCFLLRRAVREFVGEHDIKAYPCQDADYRWRIAMKFDSLHIPQPLISWRLHPHSLTGTLSWRYVEYTDIRVRRRLGMISPVQAWHEYGEIDIA
jgi:glycosyltransferase involved in cell wall biosynthesis